MCDFMNFLDDKEIIEINDKISSEYEAAKILRQYPKDTVILNNIEGYDMPVISGICNTRAKIADSINCEVSEITEKIINAIQLKLTSSLTFLIMKLLTLI